MSLDTILSHIINEANSQREKAIQDAKQKADLIILQAQEEAKALYKEIVDKEKALLENQRRKALVNARVESRKRLLGVKQGLIDEVFEKLKSQIGKDKITKQQILRDKVKEVAEDADFYFKETRNDFETEIAKIIFK